MAYLCTGLSHLKNKYLLFDFQTISIEIFKSQKLHSQLVPVNVSVHIHSYFPWLVSLQIPLFLHVSVEQV